MVVEVVVRVREAEEEEEEQWPEQRGRRMLACVSDDTVIQRTCFTRSVPLASSVTGASSSTAAKKTATKRSVSLL